ncbi:MAG: inorganic pyrophosphatase [Planctomycetota bacterium]|nr:inorganic pyrophosphatase [Planctomycetota bacterium]
MSTSEPFEAFRRHPWHGLQTWASAPSIVNAFIEITPFDVVKYELDKQSGYLKIDRPQRLSSTPPTLYGFIPRTLCGPRVAKLFGTGGTTGATTAVPSDLGADNDPLDICVFSERPVNRQEIIVQCQVVGGITMLDGGTADDKIIAVMRDDAIWAGARTLEDLPPPLIERLVHFFSTYKMRPGHASPAMVLGTYGPRHAERVIRESIADYNDAFPGH